MVWRRLKFFSCAELRFQRETKIYKVLEELLFSVHNPASFVEKVGLCEGGLVGFVLLIREV